MALPARQTAPRCRHADEEGFTLIEMVVALALLGLLLGGLYSLFAGTINTWRKAEAKAELEQNLRLVTRLLAADLENLVAGVDAGITGASASDEDIGEDTAGYLRLVTAPSHAEYGSMVEVAYEVTDAGLTRSVYRAPQLQAPQENAPAPLEAEVVSPLVRRLTFQFWLNGEWLDELLAEAAVPQAVRVSVWAGAGDDEAAWVERTVEVNVRAGASLQQGVTEP